MFSMTGDVMNTKTNWMVTETFDGIMAVKYHNISTGKKAHWDIDKDPVNSTICDAVHFAHSRHKMKILQKKRKWKNRSSRMDLNLLLNRKRREPTNETATEKKPHKM